jgi:hypothetical protein
MTNKRGHADLHTVVVIVIVVVVLCVCVHVCVKKLSERGIKKVR